MFRETRTRIILAIMTVAILLLAATLGTVYVSSYNSLKKENMEMLKRYVEIYSLEALPGENIPAPPEGRADPEGNLFDLSSFYSVAISDDGEILAVDTGRNGSYTKEDIIALSESIPRVWSGTGTHSHYIFCVEHRDGYVLKAFMDIALTQNSMGKVLINAVIAGVIAVCALFFVALFFAHMIVRPLEENDIKQKQFVSDAGHELKTPISVISANAELLARQTGDNEWLNNIQYENERMGNLVRELLDLSRAENKTVPFENVDLSKLTQQEVLPFESIAFENGLMIETHIEEGVTVKGNRGQLGQLISILTDNAISHTDAQRSTSSDVVSDLTVNIRLKKDHRHAILSVKNMGEAIPEDVRERLFDRFYKTDEAREDNGGHYGLGLSIAKAIVTAHKGTINVECPDGFIVFCVRLPIER
ncbi:MAG: HAMP domain-containing histidine kinase [Lachnospiraceae bacterium]|nr:HAMP domain-containing histidine kinase [Lachnospiraceae bacterium]